MYCYVYIYIHPCICICICIDVQRWIRVKKKKIQANLTTLNPQKIKTNSKDHTYQINQTPHNHRNAKWLNTRDGIAGMFPMMSSKIKPNLFPNGRHSASTK